MTAPTLWQRLKQARIVQVLVVYFGATWFVLQLVGTFRDLLSLPDWGRAGHSDSPVARLGG
jgi:hypothetical protein